MAEKEKYLIFFTRYFLTVNICFLFDVIRLILRR